MTNTVITLIFVTHCLRYNDTDLDSDQHLEILKVKKFELVTGIEKSII